MFDKDAIRLIIKGMRGEPARPFKTCSAASTLNLNPATFIHHFRELTGLTPKVFHSALRIERAKFLLADTKLSLIEVGLEVGYESHGSFSRIFRKMVGLTPKDYRGLTKGEPVKAVAAMIRHSQRERLSPSCLRIEIGGSEPGQMIAIGLFGQAMPAGVPIDGCFVCGDTATLEFQWPAGKPRIHVMAAGLYSGGTLCNAVGYGPAAAVARAEIRCADLTNDLPVSLNLRPINRCDPPILLPVQLMLLLESGRRLVR